MFLIDTLRVSLSNLRLHKVLMNVCFAYLHLKVSNVNVRGIGTSKFYVILLPVFLLKYLFFILIIIVPSLVIFKAYCPHLKPSSPGLLYMKLCQIQIYYGNQLKRSEKHLVL